MMPSSFVDSVPPIVQLMIDEDPQSICDVGPGWGKYGLMAREYLPDLERIDAVEVWQGRLRPRVAAMQDEIYDHVQVNDARNLDPEFWRGYQLILMIDVIEHMSKEQGKNLVNSMLEAGCDVIVSTPKVWVEQHDDLNPHEEHVSHWDWQDFPPPRADRSTIDSLIFQLARTQPYVPQAPHPGLFDEGNV